MPPELAPPLPALILILDMKVVLLLSAEADIFAKINLFQLFDVVEPGRFNDFSKFF